MSPKEMLTAMLLTAVLSLPASAWAGEIAEDSPTHAEMPGNPGTSDLAATAARGFLHPELIISQGGGMVETERYAPDVATNYVRDEYLVVWHNQWSDGHRDIYARRLTTEGRLLSWFAVSTGPEDRMQPAVAFNASDAEYLVVWMKDVSGNGTQYEIWGRTFAWDGSYMNPEFKVVSWPNRTFWTPRVVWNHNRNQYLIVWNAFDATTLLPTDVSSNLLAPDGTVLVGRNITTSTFPHQADVAYNWSTDEYFVAFVRSYSASATGNDIYGIRLTRDNGVVPGSTVAIRTEAKHQNAPRLDVDGQGNLMIVWQHEYLGADNDIYAQKLNSSGVATGGTIPIAVTGYNEAQPVVAASFTGSQFLAAHERTYGSGETAVLLYRWGTGVSLQVLQIPGGAFWENGAPALSGGRRFFVAYEGDAPGDPTVKRQIYGRQFSPYGVFVPMFLR